VSLFIALYCVLNISCATDTQEVHFAKRPFSID
jgi:hypothetical protein